MGPAIRSAILVGLVAASACGGGGGSSNDLPDAKHTDLKPIDSVWKDKGADGGDNAACESCEDNDVQEGPKDIPIPDGFTGCQDGKECESGFCVMAPEGVRVCAPLCGGGVCAPAWECKPMTGTGSGVIFVCMPVDERLCRPCSKDDDCLPPGVDNGDRCVDRGAPGSFCGKDCSVDGMCPAGYSCTDILAATLQRQCLPSSGECKCTKAFSDAGYKTSCYVENEFGKCSGERQCTPGGLNPCSAKAPQKEQCDNVDNDCDGKVDDDVVLPECEKTFGQFICKGPTVCNAGVPVCKATEPGPETCDGIDNDCDGVTDPEGTPNCESYFVDGDGDSWGVGDALCLCGPSGKHTAKFPGDCNDQDGAVNPGNTESCDFKDNDCDGETDEQGATGCKDLFEDGDGDGWGTGGEGKCLCAPSGKYKADKSGDCDDSNAAAHPGLPEMCNGFDDDCDGKADPEGVQGCTVFYWDNDGDGYGVETNSKCLCSAQGKYSASIPGDCNDNDPKAIGGGAETCDGKDNDCDGDVDEPGAIGCGNYYADKDGDGFGAAADVKCLCAPQPPYVTQNASDCADTDAGVHPGAQEQCNAKDDDCNGTVDDENATGCKTLYYDADADGYGVSGNSKCLCAPGPVYSATKTGDCNDKEPLVFPGAIEMCDAKDNDCDGSVDEGDSPPGCKKYYYDGDGDGWGVAANSKCLCAPIAGYVADLGDCDDSNASIMPGGYEACDGKDNDCDGETDEGEGASWCVKFYWDGDMDGYGDQWNSKCLCKPNGKYSTKLAGDCDDANAAIKPGAAENCDLLDNDCNGQTDEGFSNDVYKDVGTGLTHTKDLPDQWPGPAIGTCGPGQSCTGSQTARLLPKGDKDWMRVYKAEEPDQIAPGPKNIHGQVLFKGAAESKKSYVVCICFSKNLACDQSKQVCQTSYEGTEVSVEVVNPDVFPGENSAYLDIQVSPANASQDASCMPYSLTWKTWE